MLLTSAINECSPASTSTYPNDVVLGEHRPYVKTEGGASVKAGWRTDVSQVELSHEIPGRMSEEPLFW